VKADGKPVPRAEVEAEAARASGEPIAQAAERRPEQRMSGLPVPQNNNYPSAAAQLRGIAQALIRGTSVNDPGVGGNRDGDQRLQTMLTLKGIAEVITAMPSKAAEFMMSPQLVADITAKDAKANANPAATQGDAAARPSVAEGSASLPAIIRKDATAAHHPAALPGAAADDASEQEMRLAASRSGADSQPAARAVDAGHAAIAKAATSLDPVPFAFAALQPAKEEFKAEAAEEKSRHDDEDEGAEEQEQEDPEARRERLARKATDDLLRPEPETDPDMKITRDSSQADRAYALYQRMAGF
jgi:hypothetical protein